MNNTYGFALYGPDGRLSGLVSKNAILTPVEGITVVEGEFSDDNPAPIHMDPATARRLDLENRIGGLESLISMFTQWGDRSEQVAEWEAAADRLRAELAA